jgi:Ca2+-binding RTX toxin-like protein
VTDQAATTTVFDDGAEDVLTGSAGSDWFFANLSGAGVKDKVTDLSAKEFATDLDVILAP